jgi:hypothetical protein
MTVLALFCTWIIVPSLKARRFIDALAAGDYRKADDFFRDPNDRFLANWAEKRWAFEASGDTAPWTFGQLLRGQKQIVIRCTYFEFDQNARCTATVVAKPLGLGPPVMSPVTHSGKYIDAVRESSLSR